MPAHTKNSFTVRIPDHVHEKLQMAADLVGLKLDQFVMQAGLEKASEVILNESTIVLTRRESMRLLELLENPPPFNPKLQSLMERHGLESRLTRQDLDAEGRQRIRYDADTDILHFELTDQPIVREETCVWEVRVSYGEAGIARISVPSVTAKEMLR